MNLSKYIAELLVKNNCVIVPNFGGFIANYKPAVIDELKQKIYPPSKGVLFNVNLMNNDGLLANHVSKQIGNNYSEALNLIDEVSTDWKNQLKKGDRISIGEVGFLYQADNKIQFEQDREFNLYLGAYGFSTVNFVPMSEEQVQKTVVENNNNSVIEIGAVAHSSVISIDKKETLIVELPQQKSNPIAIRSNRWKYLAVACFLPALFYSYWIPMETHYLDSGNIQMADFNPMNKKADKIYKTRNEKTELYFINIEVSSLDKIKNSSTSAKYYNYQFSEDIYIPVDLNVNIGYNTDATLENNFHLIAGCFGDKNNAKLLVKDFKSQGYSASIIDKNKGLYRVSVQSFPNKSKAVDFKSNLLSKSISTWLLVK